MRRRLTVQVNVRGRDVAGFVADAREAIDAQVSKPAGYFIAWGGQFENLQEATGRLAVAVPAVLGYNWLVRRNKAVMEDVNAFGSDLHSVLLASSNK